MTRLPDWRERLIAYVASVKDTPFEPGKLDCALFAAGAVTAMTGKDLAETWRGYQTIEDGMKALRAENIHDHIALAATLLEEVHPAFANPGDIAVVPQPEGMALGVVQGHSIYLVTPRGLTLEPLTAAKRAFRV